MQNIPKWWMIHGLRTIPIIYCFRYWKLKYIDIVLKHPPGWKIHLQSMTRWPSAWWHCRPLPALQTCERCLNWRWRYSEKKISVDEHPKFRFLRQKYTSARMWCIRIGRWCGQRSPCSWNVKLLSQHFQTLLTCLPDLVTTGTAPLSNVVTLCKCCQ